MGNTPMAVKSGVLRVIKCKLQRNLPHGRTITRKINPLKGFTSEEILFEGDSLALEPLVFVSHNHSHSPV
jgi:hypothetical protein